MTKYYWNKICLKSIKVNEKHKQQYQSLSRGIGHLFTTCISQDEEKKIPNIYKCSVANKLVRLLLLLGFIQMAQQWTCGNGDIIISLYPHHGLPLMNMLNIQRLTHSINNSWNHPNKAWKSQITMVGKFLFYKVKVFINRTLHEILQQSYGSMPYAGDFFLNYCA